MRASTCPLLEQALLRKRWAARRQFGVSAREMLGVSWNCSEEEVRKAFRQRAKALHPDMQPDGSDKEAAAAKFRDIQEAYEEVLREVRGLPVGKPISRQRHNGPEPAYKSREWDAARRQSPPSKPGFRNLSMAAIATCMALTYISFSADEQVSGQEKQEFAAKHVRLRQEQAEREQRELKRQLEQKACGCCSANGFGDVCLQDFCESVSPLAVFLLLPGAGSAAGPSFTEAAPALVGPDEYSIDSLLPPGSPSMAMDSILPALPEQQAEHDSETDRAEESKHSRKGRKRVTEMTQVPKDTFLAKEETLEQLRKVPIFASLDAKDLERVAGIAQVRAYEQDEVIVNYGMDVEGLHIVLSGSAQISVPQPAGTLSAGQYTGAEALQVGQSRASSQLTAGADVRTLCVSRAKYEDLKMTQPKLKKDDRVKARKMIGSVSTALQMTRNRKISLPPDVCHITGHRKVLDYQKTDEDRQMISKGLKNNKILSEVVGLTQDQCDHVVSATHLIEVPSGTCVFKKGDLGTALFIVQEGLLKVNLVTFEVVLRIGDTFGELALLYDEPRTATIEATRDCRLWVLPRTMFKEMLQSTAVLKAKEYSMMLHQVPLIREQVDLALLSVLAGALEETVLDKDEFLCVRGEDEGMLFLIASGFCSVIDADPDDQSHVKKGLLKGDWIGEMQLSEMAPATRTVVVQSEKATVLSLDSYHFELVKQASQDHTILEQVKASRGGVQEVSNWLKKRRASTTGRRPSTISERGVRIWQMKDFETAGALGEGNFGLVLLLRDKETRAEYAFKGLNKLHLEQEKQDSMLKNERNVLSLLDSPFIIHLHGCFHDSNFVYFLLEVALGGELFDIYNDYDLWGKTDVAQFYVACVSLGLAHIHSKHIVWRDLKLENCLVNSKGYAKLTDMGIAKMVTGKTYTVCGTADYFAPETLKQVGHNRAADWWALGVMLFIMMAGHSPFDAPEVTQIYKNIIKGLSKVQFPPSISKEAEECVRSLCRKKPEDRLTMQRGGISNLMSLAFFDGFNWEEVKALTMTPPWIPPEPDYGKIAARQLSRPVEIQWDELQLWLPSDEAPQLPGGPSSHSMENVEATEDPAGWEPVVQASEEDDQWLSGL
ncbi:Prkg1 [Symbiodinium natans]|uniref:Prkg1 protein n=1 Tax=Symbiodinium natans TaxID=878477 RepID=A0A812IEY3_9DINO|nr:Prkg1 [Symbiodinium natans]